jgi:hypothetical protein
MFRKVHVTVESAPLPPRAVHEDRVIDVVTDLDRELSLAYSAQLRDRRPGLHPYGLGRSLGRCRRGPRPMYT